ncbi:MULTISPECIES: hypothetical protein [unclassified Streptomyces]|uniref:hypothetical protein n=1 Tax=unclassified Streptomyces TaxID=2593676 RepID=UPI0038026D3A
MLTAMICSMQRSQIRRGAQGPHRGGQGCVERADVPVVESPGEFTRRFVVEEDDAPRQAELVLLDAQVAAGALLDGAEVVPGWTGGPYQQPSLGWIGAGGERHRQAAARRVLQSNSLC